MENISTILKDFKIKKVSTTFEFQEICLEIIEKAGLNKQDEGLVWKLWNKGGYPKIRGLLAELKEVKIERPVIYIKYLLKDL